MSTKKAFKAVWRKRKVTHVPKPRFSMSLTGTVHKAMGAKTACGRDVVSASHFFPAQRPLCKSCFK